TGDLFNTKLQQRIEVTEQNDGNIGFFSGVSNQLQDFCDSESMLQRAFGSALDHRAVGHWIAKGNTQLDERSAGAREFDNQLAGGFEIRIACGDERDEAFAVGAFEPGKCLCDARHQRLRQEPDVYSSTGLVPSASADGSVKPGTPVRDDPVCRQQKL